MLATDTRHHGYYCSLLSCSKQYDPIDLLLSGEDSPKEKGQWDLRKGGKKVEEAGVHGVIFPSIKDKAHYLSSCPCSVLIAVFCSQPVSTGSRWCAGFYDKFLVFLCMYSTLYSKSLAT